jgi:myo-inositol 2-dehydrogenase/D-chiro-inositol 1-dehydrogenase
MTLNVGAIGAGRIGKMHIDYLVNRVPDANVVTVADVFEDAAKETAAAMGIPKATNNYQDILSDSSIDAVVIFSSTDTHAQIITEAAQAGKHIFCEKPIDHDLGKIDRALAAVDAAGVKFMIGFQRRFDPNFARAKQAILNGEIGDLHMFHIISRDPGPPPIEYIKVSGGIFFDMTIHDFDMSRFLTGDEVEEVYARADVKVDPAIGKAGDWDTAKVLLTFKNGVIGSIENSRKATYGYDQRVEVFGSGGALNVGNNTASNVTISDGSSVHHEKPLHFFIERYEAAYESELRAFTDIVLNDKPSPVTGKDGRAPVVIAMAATKSAKENRPVKLSEVDIA